MKTTINILLFWLLLYEYSYTRSAIVSDSVSIIVFVSDTVQPHQSSALSVTLISANPVSGFQFDIKIPQSISVHKDSISLCLRKSDHVITAQTQESGAIRILCYSPSLKNFTGTNGEIVTIPITAGDSSGLFPVLFSNIVAGDSTGKNIAVTGTGGFIYVSTLTNIESFSTGPKVSALSNFPNPFNSQTTLSFTLTAPSHVSMELFNSAGQKISAIFDGSMDTGEQRFRVLGNTLSSGMYFVKLTVIDRGFQTRSLLKLLYLK